MRILVALILAGLLADDEVAPPEVFKPDQKEHWAYQPVERPEPPDVKGTAWVRNPIDRFILAELEAVDFAPAPEADRIALIRRLTFDLTGLPPSPEEVEAFLIDRRSDAYERLVDRLLESPQYGVRWAQHWLDLAHYADTNGFELDAERPDAWRYRDWVVAALNNDTPYDQFLTLQLAGDEVQPDDPSALIATGFARSGPREVVGGNIDPVVRRQSELTEVTGTVGSVFLGLTVACARCHDHKFDALPTTDYYRLQAFFAASKYIEKSIATDAEREAVAAANKAIAEKVAPLKRRLADLEAPYRKTLLERKRAALTEEEKAALATPVKERTARQKKLAAGAEIALKVTWEEVAEAITTNPEHHATRERLKREIHAIEVTAPRPPAHAMALIDDGKDAPETFVYRRGDPKLKGPKVAPRPPGIILASMPKDAFPDTIPSTETTTGRRLALARWLTRPDNPLTARVIVNRLWQHHFGRGIVATPSDFGVRGEPPSHPELLDWLASELIAQGWRLKPIHRLMVTSAAYRQVSRLSASSYSVWRKQQAEDPDNTLLWRMNRRRLDAEGLRDAMLAVSGELNLKMGGPGVLAPIEKEVEDLIFTEAEIVDLWPETPDPHEHSRRSLYLFRKRNVRYPIFEAFDAPDTQTPCPQRGVSTHALQPLILLNSDFAIGRAKALAGRLFRESREPRDDRIIRVYRLVLARDPRPEEIEQARAFLDAQAKLLRERSKKSVHPLAAPTFVPPNTDPALAAAWVDFALAMLNRNEFVYVP
jgi:cytochrome c553